MLNKKVKCDGSIIILIYILVSMILFACAGAIFGALKVSLYEQSPSGMYAVYNECDTEKVRVDEPCEIFKDKVDTLGKRQKDQAIFWAIVFGVGPGIATGLFFGNEIWKQKYKVTG